MKWLIRAVMFCGMMLASAFPLVGQQVCTEFGRSSGPGKTTDYQVENAGAQMGSGKQTLRTAFSAAEDSIRRTNTRDTLDVRMWVRVWCTTWTDTTRAPLPPDTIPTPPDTTVTPPPAGGDDVSIIATASSTVDVRISWDTRDPGDTEWTLWVQGTNSALVPRPAPNPSTATLPRRASDYTATIMGQGFPSRIEFVVGSVLVPGTGGVSPPPPPPPPPTGGAHFSADLSTFTDDATLHAVMDTRTKNNVHADPGIGMRYDFIPRPTHCNDQSLNSHIALPTNTREVWVSLRMRYSTNWTNANPNCTSPSPDYKAILVFLDDRNLSGGHDRFDMKIGSNGTNWNFSGPGFPGLDNAPLSVVQPGRNSPNPIPMSQVWDGQWHDFELHYKLLPTTNEVLVQAKVDGIVMANYVTGHSADMKFGQNWLTDVMVGANRNLGNPLAVNMTIHWDDIAVWTDQTGAPASGFVFGPPDVYP